MTESGSLFHHIRLMFLAKITVYSEPENFSGIFLQNHYNGGGFVFDNRMRKIALKANPGIYTKEMQDDPQGLGINVFFVAGSLLVIYRFRMFLCKRRHGIIKYCKQV